MSVRPALPVLGWKEQVALPQWGITRLRAKLDTGARRSALHVENIEEIATIDLDGATVPVLRFVVLSGRRTAPIRHVVETPALARTLVRDTGGRQTDRAIVRTRVVCGPVDVLAEITLTARPDMNFRMLLGRRTLEHACLVDPAQGYLQTPEPPTSTRTVHS